MLQLFDPAGQRLAVAIEALDPIARRTHIDLGLRVKNAGPKPMDFVEQLGAQNNMGVLLRLYEIAREIFVARLADEEAKWLRRRIGDLPMR